MAVDAIQIGAWLRVARKRQGQFSAEQAAVRVGTTGRTMGTWERGEVAPPADTLLALVALYEANITELVGEMHDAGKNVASALRSVPLAPLIPRPDRRVSAGKPVQKPVGKRRAGGDR